MAACIFSVIGNSISTSGRIIDSVGFAIQGGKRQTLNRHRRLLPILDKKPTLQLYNYVAPNASVTGDVHVGKGASIWFGSVIRGDLSPVRIGEQTSIGDRAVIKSENDTTIGNRVIIEKGSILRSCKIEDGSKIGTRAIVDENVVIGKNSIIGAGSYVPKGTNIPENQEKSKGRILFGAITIYYQSYEYWSGNPAKYIRDVSEEETKSIIDEVSYLYSRSQEFEKEMVKSPELRQEERDYDDFGDDESAGLVKY